jgi:Type I phosphodiesterase / nucleotide pyrophosphatase
MSWLTYLLFLLLIIPSFSKPRTIIFAVDGLSSLFVPISSTNSASNSNFASNHTYPTISFLISKGSFVIARTAIEAVSGPGWTASLCSLDSSSSGIMMNTWKPALEPITKTLPCLFETLKRVDENLITHFLFSWSWLGGLASNLTRARFCGNDETITTFLCDRLLTEEALRIISSDEDWDVIVLYLNGVDQAGHTFNWGSPQYKESITLIDNHIGIFKKYFINI